MTKPEFLMSAVRRYQRLIVLDAPPVILSNELDLIGKRTDGCTALEIMEAVSGFQQWCEQQIPWEENTNGKH